jgi:hypothetical protein
MGEQSVVINLPNELYDRIRRAAADRNRPIEIVLLESLALMFGNLPLNPEAMIDGLNEYSDEQLWAIVYQRLAWPEEARLKQLVALGKQQGLSADEQAELERLLDLVDGYTLLRSQVIALLKARGHDVEGRLKLSA